MVHAFYFKDYICVCQCWNVSLFWISLHPTYRCLLPPAGKSFRFQCLQTEIFNTLMMFTTASEKPPWMVSCQLVSTFRLAVRASNFNSIMSNKCNVRSAWNVSNMKIVRTQVTFFEHSMIGYVRVGSTSYTWQGCIPKGEGEWDSPHLAWVPAPNIFRITRYSTIKFVKFTNTPPLNGTLHEMGMCIRLPWMARCTCIIIMYKNY